MHKSPHYLIPILQFFRRVSELSSRTDLDYAIYRHRLILDYVLCHSLSVWTNRSHHHHGQLSLMSLICFHLNVCKAQVVVMTLTRIISPGSSKQRPDDPHFRKCAWCQTPDQSPLLTPSPTRLPTDETIRVRAPLLSSIIHIQKHDDC